MRPKKLALASTEGKVQLALRNPQNTTTVNTTGATISSLLASYGGETDLRKDQFPTLSARPDGLQRTDSRPTLELPPSSSAIASSPPPTSVEVIKGMTRTDIKF